MGNYLFALYCAITVIVLLIAAYAFLRVLGSSRVEEVDKNDERLRR